jgi:hypothetical protein
MDFEVVDALKSAGVPEDKARAVVVSLHREIDQRYALHASQLATRGDLAEVKAELKHDLAELKRALVESKVELKLHVAEAKADLIRWTVGSFIAMAGVFTAISRLISH